MTKYIVAADTHVTDFATDEMDYNEAKAFYDRWQSDPEVFNIVMYKIENGKSEIMHKDEIV